MIRLGIDARVVQDRPSGLVSYTKNLLRNLIKDESFELFIFGQQKYRSVFSEFLVKKNVRFVNVYFNPHFLSLSNFIYESLYYHLLIHSYNLDVFHNPFGYGVPCFLKNKVLLTVHDVIPLYSYDVLTPLQKMIYKKSLSISLSKANHVVSISEFTKNDLLKNFPTLSESFVSVVHNGFDDFTHNGDDSKTYEDLKKKYSLPEKYLIYLGSGTERKNVFRMIEGFIAWKKKTQARHKIVLISKFNRPETAITLTRIQNLLSAQGLLSDMIHIQYVDNVSKAALLSHADLFIYPSIYEGFGLPLLEAASCNIPICCSDMPIFHEVCGEGALYFDPFDPKSISQAINACISDSSLRNRLTMLARERIGLFSWEKMTNQYIQIYKRIASRTTS